MTQIDPTVGTAVVHPSVTVGEEQYLRCLLREAEKDMREDLRTGWQMEAHREEPGRFRLTCPLSKTFPAGHSIHSWRAGFARGAVDARRALADTIATLPVPEGTIHAS